MTKEDLPFNMLPPAMTLTGLITGKRRIFEGDVPTVVIENPRSANVVSGIRVVIAEERKSIGDLEIENQTIKLDYLFTKQHNLKENKLAEIIRITFEDDSIENNFGPSYNYELPQINCFDFEATYNRGQVKIVDSQQKYEVRRS